MAEQAFAFLDECLRVYNALKTKTDADFERNTFFKDWTINKILKHLHAGNQAVLASLQGDEAFEAFIKGGDYGRMEKNAPNGLALLEAWMILSTEIAAEFSKTPPKKRLKWFGPSMSARSSITARFMETWSHSQAIWDEFGIERHSGDGLKNICVLGVNTYNWTYNVRESKPPGPMPYLKLNSPSNDDVWEWGKKSVVNYVEGSSEEFCQVVTQCRNIKDTNLKVVGDIAIDWMSKAQCFAGPPETPPPAGSRRKRASAGL